MHKIARLPLTGRGGGGSRIKLSIFLRNSGTLERVMTNILSPHICMNKDDSSIGAI